MAGHGEPGCEMTDGSGEVSIRLVRKSQSNALEDGDAKFAKAPIDLHDQGDEEQPRRMTASQIEAEFVPLGFACCMTSGVGRVSQVRVPDGTGDGDIDTEILLPLPALYEDVSGAKGGMQGKDAFDLI